MPDVFRFNTPKPRTPLTKSRAQSIHVQQNGDGSYTIEVDYVSETDDQKFQKSTMVAVDPTSVPTFSAFVRQCLTSAAAAEGDAGVVEVEVRARG